MILLVDPLVLMPPDADPQDEADAHENKAAHEWRRYLDYLLDCNKALADDLYELCTSSLCLDVLDYTSVFAVMSNPHDVYTRNAQGQGDPVSEEVKADRLRALENILRHIVDDEQQQPIFSAPDVVTQYGRFLNRVQALDEVFDLDATIHWEDEPDDPRDAPFTVEFHGDPSYALSCAVVTIEPGALLAHLNAKILQDAQHLTLGILAFAIEHNAPIYLHHESFGLLTVPPLDSATPPDSVTIEALADVIGRNDVRHVALQARLYTRDGVALDAERAGIQAHWGDPAAMFEYVVQIAEDEEQRDAVFAPSFAQSLTEDVRMVGLPAAQFRLFSDLLHWLRIAPDAESWAKAQHARYLNVKDGDWSARAYRLPNGWHVLYWERDADTPLVISRLVKVFTNDIPHNAAERATVEQQQMQDAHLTDFVGDPAKMFAHYCHVRGVEQRKLHPVIFASTFQKTLERENVHDKADELVKIFTKISQLTKIERASGRTSPPAAKSGNHPLVEKGTHAHITDGRWQAWRVRVAGKERRLHYWWHAEHKTFLFSEYVTGHTDVDIFPNQEEKQAANPVVRGR